MYCSVHEEGILYCSTASTARLLWKSKILMRLMQNLCANNLPSVCGRIGVPSMGVVLEERQQMPSIAQLQRLNEAVRQKLSGQQCLYRKCSLC